MVGYFSLYNNDNDQKIFNYDHLKFKFLYNLLILPLTLICPWSKNFKTIPFVQFQNSLVFNGRENGTGIVLSNIFLQLQSFSLIISCALVKIKTFDYHKGKKKKRKKKVHHSRRTQLEKSLHEFSNLFKYTLSPIALCWSTPLSFDSE